jgi:repressor LexA
MACGDVPTVREIAAHFGFASPKAITDHLTGLERKGYLSRAPGRSRNIRLADSATGIPVLGLVPAGVPLTAIETFAGRLSLPGLFPEPDHFALQVKGASMRDAGILDGDYVIVRLQPDAPDNAIVVAYLDGEATVKRLRRTRHGYRLLTAPL